MNPLSAQPGPDRVSAPAGPAAAASTDVFDFTVIEETADWIVVNKPAPLQIHPSKPGGPPTLWHGLRALLSYDLVNGSTLSIINRLDRETSGLVLIAKHSAAARAINKAMMRREIRKEYTAIVTGWPEAAEWTVDAPILRRGEVEDSPVYLMQKAHPEGTPSLTRFRTLRRLRHPEVPGGRLALVAAVPHTGRMHQIRVHLAHSGHSVLGDKLYGPDPTWYLRQIRDGWTPEAAAALLLPRQALHSTRLGLTLPDGPPFDWTAPLPPEWQPLLTEPRDAPSP